jgi:dienelactone hydrolase
LRVDLGRPNTVLARLLRAIGTLLVILATIGVGAPVADGAGQIFGQRDLSVGWPISGKVTSSIVTYQTTGNNPVTVQGRLNMPKTASPTNKVPAVVYLHGTDGVDGRGAFNAWALNEAGIATLEIDMWAARGLPPSTANRSRLQPTLPFAYGALYFLASQPMIDTGRIGVEGESMGGGITLRAASEPYLRRFTNGALHFAAHLSFYPNCTELVMNEHLPPMTGVPMHILLGDNDADTSVEDCQALAKQIGAGITVYPGATHQWDEQQGRSFEFFDPLANRGSGGRVQVTPSPQLAEASRAFGVSFFRQAFRIP